MSTSLAQVAGPGLAGLLVQLLGAARAIAADSASFLASALAVLWIRKPEDRAGASERRGAAGELVDGLRFVSTHRILRAQIVIIAYTVIGGHFIDGVQYVFAYREAHLTPAVAVITVVFFGAMTDPVANINQLTLRQSVTPDRCLGRPTDTIRPQPA